MIAPLKQKQGSTSKLSSLHWMSCNQELSVLDCRKTKSMTSFYSHFLCVVVNVHFMLRQAKHLFQNVNLSIQAETSRLTFISHYIQVIFILLISNHWWICKTNYILNLMLPCLLYRLSCRTCYVTLFSRLCKPVTYGINFIWRPPTLPHRLQCSTIGRLRLNHRVRDGNGCDP